MLKHWQTALAAAVAAAVLATTMAASLTTLAQAYLPTDWSVFRQNRAGAFSERAIHSTDSRTESPIVVASAPPEITAIWSAAATMSSIRDWPAAVVAGDNLYVLGGASPDLRNPPQTGMLSSVERSRIHLDGSLESWQTTSSLATGRSAFGAVAHGNHVYALGGKARGFSRSASEGAY